MHFEEQDCINCGVRFGVPAGFTQHRRNDKRNFYCPNGHSMAYTQNEADRLRIERDRLKQQIAQKDDEILAAQRGEDWQRRLRESAERKAAAARGQVTKLKKRAAAGVCPCCHRQFTDLQRHMAGKHPGFLAEAVEGDNIVPLRKEA